MFQITPRERIVSKIKHPTLPPRLVRAVIYARVSSIHETQKTSLEAQTRYFTKVAKEKGWFLTDIYAEKRSAKRYDSRPEFKRMIEDSYLDRFDIVLTKSISRFGRDTIETLETLRKLRANGIDVFFDLEQLHSIDDRNTHVITTLEAIAQEENRVRSENIRWGIEKSLQNANSRLYQRICFGYRHNAEGLLVIKEEEAQIVRKKY